MRRLLMLALLALALAMLPALAGAQTGDVPYLDAEGREQTRTGCTLIQGTQSFGATTLNSGWYAFSGEIVYNAPLTISGDVHLILRNGAKVDAVGGITVPAGSSLTIYAQKGPGMGRLSAKGVNTGAGIGGGETTGDGQDCGTVVINGGYVNALGGPMGGAGIGGSAGKKESTDTGVKGGKGGSVTINGGSVTATGVYGGAGIGGGRGYNNGGIGSVGGDGGSLSVNGGLILVKSKDGAAIGGGYNANECGLNGSLTFSPRAGRSIAAFDEKTNEPVGVYSALNSGGNHIGSFSGLTSVAFETRGGYGVLEGDGQIVTAGSAQALTVRASGDYSSFCLLRINGRAVDSGDYSIRSGSTIATLRAGYVASLPVGDYTMTFVYHDGSADAHFRVVSASAETPAPAAPDLPRTGDGSHLLLWLALTALGALGAAALLAGKRPRRE